MRIVHVVCGRPDPDSLNGVDRAVYHMTAAQAQLGLDVILLARHRTAPVPADGVEAHVIAPSRWPFGVPTALVRTLETRRPDVLHLHSPYSPEHVPVVRWARRHRVPYVMTPHGALSPGEIRHRWMLKIPYKYAFERGILNGAAFVHALGAHEGLERYGVRSPIVIVPNGITPPDPPAARAQPLRNRYPQLAGKKVFLFVGRLDPLQKGLDVLMAGVAQSGLADIALVIAGPDWRGYRRRLERALASQSLSVPVILTDALVGREKIEALVEADVFVHTSRWEGMSQAVLEAAALRRPCLLSRAADPLGRLGESGAAVIVDPVPEAVARAVRRLHDMSTGDLIAMGARARKVVLGEFTWRRTAEELGEVYRRYAGAGT